MRMIQGKVYIEKENHKYYDHDGNSYSSVSSILSKLKEPFDEKFWAKKKSKQMNISEAEILKSWDIKRENSQAIGNRIHDALEKYRKFALIDDSNKDLERMILTVATDYVEYIRTYAECVLYSPKLAALGTYVAGTADLIMAIDSRGKYFDLEDYKTNAERGIQFYPQTKEGKFLGKYLHEPVSHLTECNFHIYSLQLSIYATMVEELTGMKLRKMWIRFIPPNDVMSQYKIPIPFMKLEAEAVLMNYHYERVGIKGDNIIEEEELPNFDI